VASGAWSMPTGVQPDNFVLLAISEVLHRFARPVDRKRTANPIPVGQAA